MTTTAPSASVRAKMRDAAGRVGTPQEIARTALYLASDDSAFVTGAALLVDGGASITRT
ncbi:MAG: SDR family oxidoreductase [Variovorax sp.]